jgi:hypothetical protein
MAATWPNEWRFYQHNLGDKRNRAGAGKLEFDQAVTELVESLDRRWLLEQIVGRRHLPCRCECTLSNAPPPPAPAKSRRAA